MQNCLKYYIANIFFLLGVPAFLTAQMIYDTTFIKPHQLPNYATIDFQHTGSGLHFYNKDNGIIHGPVYPFESAIAVGLNISYKFINIGYMKTIQNKVNRSAF